MDVQLQRDTHLDDNKRGVLDAFVSTSGYVDDTTESVRCAVPVGGERRARAAGSDESSDRRGPPDGPYADGFPASRRLQSLGSGDLASDSPTMESIDAVVVSRSEVGLVEVATGESDRPADLHGSFGRLLLEGDLFREENPSWGSGRTVSLVLVVEEWPESVPVELLAPTYRSHGVDVFDVSRGDWLVDSGGLGHPWGGEFYVTTGAMEEYDVGWQLQEGRD